MSVKLIESFRNAHTTLLSSIDQVQMASRSYSLAKPSLRTLNAKVIAHLGRQDNQFTDKLLAFYAGDREASKMLEFLVHDLKDIKIKFLVFYDKHSGELADTNARSFPKDLAEFIDELINRIKMEEEYLFPLLKKLA